jgi:hypothetical protein
MDDDDDDIFLPDAYSRGDSLEDLGVVSYDANGALVMHTENLLQWYQELLPLYAHPSGVAAANVGANVGGQVNALASALLGLLDKDEIIKQAAALGPGVASIIASLPPALWDRMLGNDQLARAPRSVELWQTRRDEYVAKLATQQVDQVAAGPIGKIIIPTTGVGTSIRTVQFDLEQALQPARPTIAIIETWQLTAFLGDYGLGQTVGAESLFPGETKSVSVQTWSTDTSSQELSSSVFDSVDNSAQSRFTDQIAKTDNTTTTESGAVAASLATKTGASAQVYMVNMYGEIEAAVSANYQAGRQNFDGKVHTTVREHANQCNSARRTAVGAVTSQQREAGSIGTTFRELSNTNLRRVLNFVFRELNQEYKTVTSLRDIQVVLYNGRPGSADRVTLGELSGFLKRYLVEAKVEEVAREILGLIVQCVDEHGDPQTMLQVGTRNGGVFEWQDASLDIEGHLDFVDSPLNPTYSWRIKPGPIGQEGNEPTVPGVVNGRTSVVMRTDSIVAEALLGQADALDPYASGLQELDLQARHADLSARDAEIRRLVDALDLVKEAPAEERVEAWNTMLGARPQVDVTATVDGAGDHKPPEG